MRQKAYSIISEKQFKYNLTAYACMMIIGAIYTQSVSPLDLFLLLFSQDQHGPNFFKVLNTGVTKSLDNQASEDGTPNIQAGGGVV